MGVLDSQEYKEYMSGGGLLGASRQAFLAEWNEAHKNKNHPFRKTVTALQEGNQGQTARIFCDALSEIRASNPAPLSRLDLALLFATMFLTRAAMEYAEEHFYDDDAWEQLPNGIIRLAAAGVIDRELKSRAGRNKGAANREKIIDQWQKYPSKDKGVAAFARWLSDNWNKLYNQNGKKGGNAPSEKIIAEKVYEYKKTLPDTGIR